MQIILVHHRFSQAKSITLTHKHILLAALLFILAVVCSAALLFGLTLKLAPELPVLRGMVSSAAQESPDKNDRYVKENIAAMAVTLGEMQAQMMRLDALGARVQGLAGVKPEEFNFKEKPGRGGAEPSSMSGQPAHELSLGEFQQALNAMHKDLEQRSDYMNVVESTLMSFKIKSRLMPTVSPVNVGYNASSFGWRMDPFNGRGAFHEGIDFAAPTGTPIMAAAGGVVIAAEFHPQFGNMLEIDHGNDIVTRYAHASRLVAKVGDIVRRGQHVADIGSTGRSTGSHLHFEVHVKGVVQDPRKFLSAGADQAKIAALDAGGAGR